MARKPVVRSNHHFYHLTARSNNKEHFYVSPDTVWEIMITRLRELQKEHDLKISAFVLMNNHYHLLLLTPTLDIDRVMYFFMKSVTSKLQKASGRINKIFCGRYKGCVIENQRYLMNVYKYVYRNPVAAGLSQRAELYPYSTLSEKFSPENYGLRIERIMPMNLQVSRKTEYDWINESFRDEEAKSLKWGLTRTTFKYQRDRFTNKVIEPS